jgi:hypothetical protein
MEYLKIKCLSRFGVKSIQQVYNLLFLWISFGGFVYSLKFKSHCLKKNEDLSIYYKNFDFNSSEHFFGLSEFFEFLNFSNQPEIAKELNEIINKNEGI